MGNNINAVVAPVPDVQADYEAMKYTQLPGESDRVTFMRALYQLATKHQEIQRQQLMNEVGHSTEPMESSLFDSAEKYNPFSSSSSRRNNNNNKKDKGL
jgi:hypothetical protein